jgi:hypothetical protein
MAYTYAEIVNLHEQGNGGRAMAEILGIVNPGSSDPDYLVHAGNRHIREAKAEVAAGNGHGLWGTKRRSNGNGGNGKRPVDPLSTIADVEIVMGARLAAKKAGISEDGNGIREAIEDGNSKVIAFLDFVLSHEQRAILEKAIGVLTPAEREAKRRSDLIASIRMKVSKAIQVKAMIASIEAIGGTVEMPMWFRDVSSIKPDTLESHSTSELEEIAASMPTA